MMKEPFNYSKMWAVSDGEKVKIKLHGNYMWIRNKIALNWMKEEGYRLFNGLTNIRPRVRDCLLESNYKTSIVMLISLLQAKR